MVRPLLTVAALLALVLVSPLLPAWSQSPGLTDPAVAPKLEGPAGSRTSNSWNLTDLLWGVAQIQQSARPLSLQQKAAIRPVVVRVLEGMSIVSSFQTRVKAILTTDQTAYVDHLALSGALDQLPDDLQPLPSGQDPLVARVLDILEKRAKE